ncbi:MAG TPA: xanthine dehydrogenase family protein subunit M, partial [Pyrinomonadaceae bacterium]|nr:xanthine dehydrogenase family protein subunit M [Pyrinomonadaceae bacterium]
LMKEDVERPEELVDVNRLGLAEIKAAPAGGVLIGALAKNTDTANHPLIRKNYPLLTQAIVAGASAQLRNMATNGGNLLQRTRCQYFYDTAMPCNKREPGSGCGALEGLNRIHAVFGWSDKCVAVYPGDMANALYALEAVVRVRGADGRERAIPVAEFHRLPGDTPERDTNLEHGELITAIELPKSGFARNYYYLKVRDRASYAFALVAVAAALEMDAGRIKRARVVLGGVAHKPWRSAEAEAALAGKPASEESFRQAAEAALAGAKPLAHNAYKVELGKRAVVRALMRASRLA